MSNDPNEIHYTEEQMAEHARREAKAETLNKNIDGNEPVRMDRPADELNTAAASKKTGGTTTNAAAGAVKKP